MSRLRFQLVLWLISHLTNTTAYHLQISSRKCSPLRNLEIHFAKELGRNHSGLKQKFLRNKCSEIKLNNKTQHQRNNDNSSNNGDLFHLGRRMQTNLCIWFPEQYSKIISKDISHCLHEFVLIFKHFLNFQVLYTHEYRSLTFLIKYR